MGAPECYWVALEVTGRVPRLARRTVRAYLLLWRMPEPAEAAEPAVSELIGNVVKHVPDRRCVLTVARLERGVRVEVRDGSPVLPGPVGAAGPCEESGRGLALVALVTHRWGVRPDGRGEGRRGGKAVWFELDAAPEGGPGGERDAGVEAAGWGPSQIPGAGLDGRPGRVGWTP